MTEKNVIGKCPVCGGDVMESPLGFCCNGTTKEGRRCQFVIHRKMHGVEMTEEICRQLLSEGRTGIMEMKNKKNQPFLAMFIIEDGKVHLDFVSHYMEGRCPICGGRVKKTSKGYACENHVGPNPTCDFYMMGIICNRKITDEEVERFLNGERLTLDGFSTNDGHMFSSTLQLNEKGSVSLESKITKCPVCGGEIHVGMKAYNCSNYKDKDHPCNFSIWRNISGHEVTVEEARQICEDGQTKEVLELYKEDGTIYYKRLGLNKENQVIRIQIAEIMKKLMIAVAVLLGMTACSDKNQQMKDLAEISLCQSLGESTDVKILGVSEPDSTFGTSYLSPEEKKAVMATMQKVTKQIMSRTNNMETFDPSDDYVINLAERQMRANADLRGMLFECDKKGEWNGWKVKIDYEAKGGHEMDYRAERWFFFDKEGGVIIKTIEFPLP